MRCWRKGALLLLTVLLAGCVQQPAHREEGTHALLFSWTPIVSINGEKPEDAYRNLILPGDYRLEVLYRTYRRDFLCHFDFTAEGGRSYEVVDHTNPEPLVLYRSVRANGAWVERLDPVLPRCNALPRDSVQP